MRPFSLLILFVLAVSPSPGEELPIVQRILQGTGQKEDWFTRERAQLNTEHTFDKDPWLRTARAIITTTGFTNVDFRTGYIPSTSAWESDVLGIVFSTPLRKQSQVFHPRNLQEDIDIVVSRYKEPIELEFRESYRVWVLIIPFTKSKLAGEIVAKIESILLPQSKKVEDGANYFLGTEKLAKGLRECVYWRTEDSLILSGSKIYSMDENSWHHLHSFNSNREWPK